MIPYISLAIAFLGSSIASYFDLKTTDVPDLIAIYMAISGVVLNSIYSYITHNPHFIVSSLVVGGIFTLLGAINYYAKLWGGADFLILGAIGFLLPYNPVKSILQTQNWPFAVSLLLNIFIVGAAYTILYSFYIAFKEKNTIKLFFLNLYKNRKGLIGITFFYAILLVLIVPFLYSVEKSSVFFQAIFNFLKITPMFLLLLLLYFFLKTIQYDVLEKNINTKYLKEGDVLAKKVVLKNKVVPANKIVGLTKEQVSDIKKELKYVKITQGVPYIPVFPIAILVTIFVGDLASKIIFSMI